MTWGVLLDPRGSPWRPALAVSAEPAQGTWFDPARLADPQPRHRLTLRCDPMGAAALVMDLGTPEEVLTHAALVSTTLTSGVLRLRGSASDPTGAAGDAFDTVLPLTDLAEPLSGTIVTRLSPAAGDPAEPVLWPDGSPVLWSDGSPVLWSVSGSATGELGPARYLRVEIAGQVPEAWVYLGLVMAGAAEVPERQYRFGATTSRLDLSRRDTSEETGVTFGRAGSAPRVLEIEVPHPRNETAWGNSTTPLSDRLRRAAAAQRDVLLIRDTTETDAAVMSRQAVWGRMESPGGEVLEMLDVSTIRWRAVERI